MDSGDDRYSTADVGRDWTLIQGPASTLIDSIIQGMAAKGSTMPKMHVRGDKLTVTIPEEIRDASPRAHADMKSGAAKSGNDGEVWPLHRHSRR